MSPPLTFGSLFAGVGGFDLGFERAGMVCKWQVEIDDYATKVLEKHWPDVRRWRDVRTFPPEPIDDWRVDVICGGFPCIDISNAGKRAGIDGQHSGLWGEFARILGVLRPRVVVVENSAALSVRGLTRILGDLCQLGLDAEWETVSACAFGATHVRRRLFLAAYSNSINGPSWFWNSSTQENWKVRSARRRNGALSDKAAWLEDQSNLYGGGDGIPNRVDRLRCLGNAVVPQVAEYIGKRIVENYQSLEPEL